MFGYAPAGRGRITVSERIDATVATLWGDVDSDLRARAGEALAVALNRGLPLIIDATHVRSIDPVGIAFLVQCCTIGKEEGLPVMLRNPPTPVQDVLRLLGLDHMFDEPNAPVAS